jgi:hypothetical protein
MTTMNLLGQEDEIMKKLLLITFLIAGCGGSNDRSVCDQANNIVQGAKIDRCAGETCCYCECVRAGSVMKCDEHTFDCATPRFKCPNDEQDALDCVEREAHCVILAKDEVGEYCN